MIIRLKELGYIDADNGVIRCNCCGSALKKLTELLLVKKNVLKRIQ